MRRATIFATFALMALAGLPLLAWFAYTALAPGASSAAPTGNLTCSVKASCDVGEVEVFRMSSPSNAHAGTPTGSGYGWSLCCGEVNNLSTSCTDVYATVVTLSGADNAHAAPDGSYLAGVCLSVPFGVADCTYGPTCGVDYECVATVSGASNAHVADCDGVDDYATKVCCRIVNDCNNDGTLDPDDPDDDGDEFTDTVEAYLSTDSCDDCPDWTGTPGLCPGPSCDGHDAWPLDLNVDGDISFSLDVMQYAGKIAWFVADHPEVQRLDLNMDGDLSFSLDVMLYMGRITDTCT